MRIGITVGLGARAERTIAGLIERAAEVERAGFASLWMPAAFSFDAITALVAVGVDHVSAWRSAPRWSRRSPAIRW